MTKRNGFRIRPRQAESCGDEQSKASTRPMRGPKRRGTPLARDPHPVAWDLDSVEGALRGLEIDLVDQTLGQLDGLRGRLDDVGRLRVAVALTEVANALEASEPDEPARGPRLSALRGRATALRIALESADGG